MICPRDDGDPLLSALLELDLNLLTIPRTGVWPGQVVLVDKQDSKLRGDRTAFDSIFCEPASFPGTPSREAMPSYFQIDASRAFDTAVGTSIIAQLLQLTGPGILSAKLKRAGTKNLTLRLDQPFTHVVEDISSLASAIEQGALRDPSMLERKRIFIVTAAFFATKLSVALRGDGDTQVRLDGNFEVVGSASANIELKTLQTGDISFESDTPLAFAVRLLEVLMHNGSLRLAGLEDPIRVRSGRANPRYARLFVDENVFMDLS